MNQTARELIYREAKRQWGEHSQCVAAAEEFSESAAVMCRWANGKVKDLAEVITELADAEIMSEQMRLYFAPELIDAEKDRKLRRLAERLGLRKAP